MVRHVLPLIAILLSSTPSAAADFEYWSCIYSASQDGKSPRQTTIYAFRRGDITMGVIAGGFVWPFLAVRNDDDALIAVAATDASVTPDEVRSGLLLLDKRSGKTVSSSASTGGTTFGAAKVSAGGSLSRSPKTSEGLAFDCGTWECCFEHTIDLGAVTARRDGELTVAPVIARLRCVTCGKEPRTVFLETGPRRSVQRSGFRRVMLRGLCRWGVVVEGPVSAESD